MMDRIGCEWPRGRWEPLASTVAGSLRKRRFGRTQKARRIYRRRAHVITFANWVSSGFVTHPYRTSISTPRIGRGKESFLPFSWTQHDSASCNRPSCIPPASFQVLLSDRRWCWGSRTSYSSLWRRPKLSRCSRAHRLRKPTSKMLPPQVELTLSWSCA